MKSHILLLFAAAILLSLGAAQDTIENPAKPLSINAGRVVTLKEEMRIEDTGDDFYFKNPFTILTCERLQDNLRRLKLVRAAGAGGACGRKVHSRAGTMLGGRSVAGGIINYAMFPFVSDRHESRTCVVGLYAIISFITNK